MLETFLLLPFCDILFLLFFHFEEDKIVNGILCEEDDRKC